jgi:hypothetical protein
MIQDESQKGLREISLGYSVELDPTPGVWQGQRYDAVQRRLVTNHVALGPEGWGRCGSEVGLRLDSGDAVSDLGAVNYDGMDPNIEKLTAELAAVKGENTALKGENAALKSRADSLAGENEVLKTRVDSAVSPDKLDSLVEKRVTLVQDAKKILGAEYDAKGKSDIEIVKAALAKELPKFKQDCSDDKLRGAFDAVVAGLKDGEEKVAKRLTVVNADGAGEPQVTKVEKRRAKFEQDSINAWKQDSAVPTGRVVQTALNARAV